MDARCMKRLNDTADRQHFVNEMAEILAPYGSVRRSQLVVEKKDRDTEVLCFVEMETPQQAEAAKNGLGLLLLGGCHLFLSAQLGANFAE